MEVTGESTPDEKPADDRGQPRVGLCVSGGGFRAAFYAIGALRYLAEAGLLAAVTDISAVSGGSLAAAKLAAAWPPLEGDSAGWLVRSVERPMREAVANNNIRNRWLGKVAAGRSLGRGGRGAVLGELFCEILELPSELHELPVGPRTIFTSTCLQTGRAFRFARAFTGSWDFGYAEPTPTGVRLGLALAASAAFPHTFTVVQMPTEPLGLPKETPSTITLVDGGVYDNLATRCSKTTPAGSSPATSTARHGSSMRSRCSRRAMSTQCRWCWSGAAPGQVATSGSSSPLRSRPRTPAGSARCCYARR